MATTVFDCARVPDSNCSVKIIGERDEVIQAARDHLVASHGKSSGGDLNQEIGQALDDAPHTYGIWGH